MKIITIVAEHLDYRSACENGLVEHFLTKGYRVHSIVPKISSDGSKPITTAFIVFMVKK